MNNKKKKFLPSNECMFCGRTIEEAGGRRIIAHHILAIGLANRHIGGGNPDYPDASIKLKENCYVHFRGHKEKWTNEIKAYVIKEFEANRHPWFCQKCSGRVCRECGWPVQYLHGCDIIYADGHETHSAILPIPPGCTNPDCIKHRK